MSGQPRVTRLSAGGVSLPLHFERGAPALAAAVNGVPMEMEIDTGATVCVLTERAAANLRISAPWPAIGTSFSGDRQVHRRGMIDRIDLGEATFFDVPVVVIQGDQLPFDGLLGFPLFSQVQLTLDFPGKRLRLDPPDTPLRLGYRLDLQDVGGIPALPIKIGDRRLDCLIDTGFSGTFAFDPDRLGVQSEPIGMGHAFELGGIVPTEFRLLKGEVEFLYARYQNPPFIVLPGENPVIGSVALQPFSITFDQRRRIALVSDAAFGRRLRELRLDASVPERAR
ncbi:MAG: retropepsin-like aspartic protease [Verrucomicrobiales bacterium]